MDIKRYADILRLTIQFQIIELEKEMENKAPLMSMDYLEGVHRGLEIALEKIDASMFLAENK